MKEMEEGAIRITLANEHKYVEVPTEQSPFPLFSIFGWPLIFKGSSGQGVLSILSTWNH